MTKHIWAYEKFNWPVADNERVLFENIELDLMPLNRTIIKLTEATLSNDQINTVFKNAENIGRENGMRTGFGKTVNFPKDTMIKINRVLTNFGTKLQNSSPVQSADTKFNDLKNVLKSKIGNTTKGQQILTFIDVMGETIKSHPKWQGAIIGLLTGISGMALGPAAIPVVAALLKGSTELIKGEKLSTAVGKGIYAGALGYLGTQAASALMGYFESVRIADITPVTHADAGYKVISFGGNTKDALGQLRWIKINNVTVDPATYTDITNTVLKLASGDLSAYDKLLEISRKVVAPEYINGLNQALKDATASKISNDGFLKSILDIKKYVTAIAGGAATAASEIKDKPKTTTTPTTAESIKLPLPIMEGLWADLTLTVGAGKLTKAWKQAGRPTDSVAIAQMLADLGLSSDDIRSALLDAGVSADDVDQTMKELATAGDDSTLEIPFTSGFKAYDDEAKKIFKNSGKDAFVKYWEKKLAELEATEIDPTTIITDLKVALKANDVAKATTILNTAGKFSADTKKRLLGLLVTAGPNVSNADRHTLAAIIRNATITEISIFEEASKLLNQHKLTWKDLGYQLIIKESRTNSMILI